MGLFLRKSLSFGPVRFNLSKSGIGVSAGVRGLRVGTGPRGAYISGGRDGVYFRESLKKGSQVRTADRVQLPPDMDANKAAKAKDSHFAPAPSPPWQAVAPVLGVSALGLIALGLSESASGVAGAGIAVLALAIAAHRSYKSKANRFQEYDELLVQTIDSRDNEVINLLQQKRSGDKRLADGWQNRCRYIYSRLFRAILDSGIDENERQWLKKVADTLEVVNPPAVHADIVRPLIWQAMEDGRVTEDEEASISKVLLAAEIPSSAIEQEWKAFSEFVRGRKACDSNLPIIDVDVNLQRGEICHHHTYGSFLETKTIRTYTRDGQRYKEEGMVPQKEGQIFITSKRILMVADGTSSIPYGKVLNVEIDPDEKLITIIKDGRQKPLYIRTTDVIYSGILIEHLSATSD
jgi:hypothetical protein